MQEETLNEIKALNLTDCTIERIGTFLWVYGDTYPFRETLKSKGFRWANNKKMWYKSPDGYKKKSHREWKFNEIQETFEREIIS